MQNDLNFLKEVLSVPTVTYREDLMIRFIVDWLEKNKIENYVDEHGNVYATKKISEVDDDFHYPCVVSHTDTVHSIKHLTIQEEHLPNAQGDLKLSLKAYDENGSPTGIGGDDKAGVFACLKLLSELPFLKAAFFVSEETGCHGSRNCDDKFFKNVGYAIQFDAPENWMVTETCSGQVMFDRESDFFKNCNEVLTENMHKDYIDYMVHPYTDVFALRSKFDFSCINFSIGYYDYHSPNEYVVVEDVYNGIKMGKLMIEKLGYKLHFKKAKHPKKFYL
jgi:putative aminopeptidase FrvX